MMFLPNHLIRPRQHIWRNRETNLLRRYQIDNEFKLRWLFHREIGWLRTFENLVYISGSAPVQVENVCPVGHEPTTFHEQCVVVHRRESIFCCVVYEPFHVNSD